MLKRVIIVIEHRPGHVQTASPNLHLIIKRGEVKPIPAKGERNTPDRPNVQVCRNSYSRRVIEVLLTGNLDDGTAGFGVIQDEGASPLSKTPEGRNAPGYAAHCHPESQAEFISFPWLIAPLLVTLIEKKVTSAASTEQTDTKETEEVMTSPGCGGVLRQYTSNGVICISAG